MHSFEDYEIELYESGYLAINNYNRMFFEDAYLTRDGEGIFAKIKRWIKELIEKIKSLFSKIRTNNIERIVVDRKSYQTYKKQKKIVATISNSIKGVDDSTLKNYIKKLKDVDDNPVKFQTVEKGGIIIDPEYILEDLNSELEHMQFSKQWVGGRISTKLDGEKFSRRTSSLRVKCYSLIVNIYRRWISEFNKVFLKAELSNL